MTPEKNLLQRVRAGDQGALTELYDQFAPRLYVYIYRRVGDQRLAEDLTGDVFVNALTALRRGRFASASLAAWLFRLAHNRVVDHYRRAQPDEPLAEWLPGPDDVPAEAARRRAHAWLLGALRRLTDDQQQVIALRFGEARPAADVARLMGKTEESVRALQHRALAALRRLMDGEGP